MKRAVALLLVALLVVAAFATGFYALTGQESQQPATPEGSPLPAGSVPARQPPDPALAGFYSQDLAWSECGGGRECASLAVPVDYARPGGETIEVALLRVPASGERLGSLVVNPGGPGASGTSYAAAAARIFRRPLLDSFDIVGFDPRGVGSSSPVDCLTDERLDAFIGADPDPDTAVEAASYRTDVLALGRGCVERTGDLVNHVTTVETARDMDVLRAALDEGHLTYFGASYGTKLGATYAELFPDRVGRFVLDGAVDVSLDNRRLALEQARGFENALTAYVEDCIAGSSPCFLGATPEEGLQRIRDLLDAVDAAPLPTDSGRELRVGHAFYGVVTPLYNRDSWHALTAALQSAEDGDGTDLLQLADLYASRGPQGYTDNSMEAIFAINCLDDRSATGFAQVEEEFAAFEEASPTFGRVFAWSLTACRGLRARSTVERPEIRAEGAAPILVVGTTRDPATPYHWAEALAEQLDSGVLLTREGDGHTGYNSANACVDETVERYLIQGAVPDDGREC